MTKALAEHKDDIKNYVFYGMILPERVNATFPSQTIMIEVDGARITLRISITLSKIVVSCKAEKYNGNIATLKNIILSALRGVIDLIGFYNGCGYEVSIESVINLDTNDFTVFGVDEPIFDGVLLKTQDNGNSSSFEIPPIIDAMKLALADHQLTKSLHHYREALREADYTSLYCYYSIECLRVSVEVKYNIEKKSAWEKLREILSIKECDINSIKNIANTMRYGRPEFQSWDIRKEHLEITWKIIAEYIKLQINLNKLV